jgi:hypothetical protein
VADQALQLFAAAQAAAPPESVYGKRIALVDTYLDGMRSRLKQLGQERGPVPEVQMLDRDRGRWREARDTFKLDGRLDEAFWADMPGVCTGALGDPQTAETPAHPTRFKVVWANGAIHFGIHCQDAAGDPPLIGTRKSGDPGIFVGDNVEILIETDSHSYYQIVVNPAGAVVDIDRKAPKSRWYEWRSEADAAGHVGDDYWSVEVKIPVNENSDDPLHVVAGRKPQLSLPWYINVCRQRTRNSVPVWSCWAPTGKKGFHVPMKFGKLYSRATRAKQK